MDTKIVKRAMAKRFRNRFLVETPSVWLFLSVVTFFLPARLRSMTKVFILLNKSYSVQNIMKKTVQYQVLRYMHHRTYLRSMAMVMFLQWLTPPPPFPSAGRSWLMTYSMTTLKKKNTMTAGQFLETWQKHDIFYIKHNSVAVFTRKHKSTIVWQFWPALCNPVTDAFHEWSP